MEVQYHEINHMEFFFDEEIQKWICYAKECPTSRYEGDTQGEAFANFVMATHPHIEKGKQE